MVCSVEPYHLLKSNNVTPPIEMSMVIINTGMRVDLMEVRLV